MISFALLSVFLLNLVKCELSCAPWKSCDECGIPEILPNVKIIGGKQAVPFSWPSQVLILQTYTFKWKLKTQTVRFVCGGTLIDRNTILTAAHCLVKTTDVDMDSFNLNINIEPNSFYPTYESMFKVYAGVFNTSEILGNGTFKIQAPTIESGVKKIKLHENYNSDLNLNDIAIFKLSKSIQPNKYIRPACLPLEQSSTYPGTNLVDSYASGWGTLRIDGPLATRLYNVKLKVYNESKCKNYGFILNDWKSQICAGNYDGGQDTCQGDSGGGLYVLENKRYILAGIVSYGMGCGLRGYPGIYTRTSYYLNWINSNR